MPSQALQIIFEMQSQKTSQNKSYKESKFFRIAIFFIFLSFDPLYFQPSYFFLNFILNDLKCYRTTT
jgi:hypothetical protein